jgi:hypothetical protein
MAKSELEIIIGLTDKTKGPLAGLTGGLKKIGLVAGGVALAGVAAMGVGVAKVLSDAIPAASNLQEAMNAVNVVFEDNAETILEWGKTASETAGLSQADFAQMAAQTGAMLQNFGLDAKSAADETINLAQRAADMASIFNTDVNEALIAIQAGLRGEADPLERFGVSLSAAAVKAKALELGLEDAEGQLSQTALTTARLALLFEQTDKIAGDFVNTSGDLANASRVQAARWENFMASIGTRFLPIIQKFQGIFMDLAEKAMPLVENALNDIMPGIERFADLVGQLIRVIMEMGIQSSEFGEVLESMFGPRIAGVIQTIISTLSSLYEIIRTLITGDFRGGIFGMQEDDPFIGFLFTVRDAITMVIDKIKVIIGIFSDFFTLLRLGNDFISSSTRLVYDLAKAFGASNEEAVQISMAFFKVVEAIQAAITWIGDFINNQVIPFVNQHGALLLQILQGVVVAFAAFSIISTVVGWITGLIAAIGAIGGAISATGGIIATIIGILGGPLTVVILAISALIGLLFVAWKNNWGGIQEKTRAVIDWIRNAINTFLTWVQNFWKAHGDQIMATVQAIWDAIVSIFEWFVDYYTTIFEAFSAAFAGDWETFGEKLREAWDMVWKLIVTAVERAWEFIKTAVSNGIKAIIEWFQNTDWKQVGIDVVIGIANGIRAGAAWAVNAIKDLAKAIWGAITGFFGAKSYSRLMATLGKDLTRGLGLGISDAAQIPVKAMLEVGKEVARTMSGIIPGGQLGVTAIGTGGRATGPIPKINTFQRGGDNNYIFVQNSAAWAAWTQRQQENEFDEIDRMI